LVFEKKIVKNTAQPTFCQNKSKFFYREKMQKMGYTSLIKKLSKVKNRLKCGRKFAQSVHPKYNAKAVSVTVTIAVQWMVSY
jgi:hypothetical protein